MHIVLGVLSLKRCYLLSGKLSVYSLNYRRFFKNSRLLFPRSKVFPQLTNSREMEGSLLQGKGDVHRGMTVNSADNVCQDLEEFENKLESSLKKWREDCLRGVWFHISIPEVNWIPILIKKGFKIHHARDELITLCIWLPEKESYKLPDYPSCVVGAGAVVINDKQQVLVVRERYRNIPFWKLPGGHVDPGEDVVDGAIREVFEETSIKAEFMSVLSIRETTRSIFKGCNDLYFAVRLRPLTLDITKEDAEIEDCQWMDVDVFLNHPDAHENNRMFVRQALQNEKDGIIMKRDKGVHPVTKVPQYMYYIEKTSVNESV